MNNVETSRLRALSVMYDIVAKTFEYLEEKGSICQGTNFSIDWNGFAWVGEKGVALNPFEAYLVWTQTPCEEIDGVDETANFAWLEEATLAEQHGTTVDFINGMIAGCAMPHANLQGLLDRYNDESAEGYAEYHGDDMVQSCCENDEEFSLGVDMGQLMFSILKEAGVYQ